MSTKSWINDLAADWPIAKAALGLYGPEVKAYCLSGRRTTSAAMEQVQNLPGLGYETLLTTGTSLYASSTAAGDTAEILTVAGLDENWAYKEETVTLTGQSQVIIGAASSWTRVFDAWISDGNQTGDVYVAESDTLTLGVPDTAAKVHGFLDRSETNRGSKCIYTVPAGKKALLLGFDLQLAGSTAATRHFWQTRVEYLDSSASVASPSWTGPSRIDQGTVMNEGSNTVERRAPVPHVFPQLTNISLEVLSSAAAGARGCLYILEVPA